MSQQAPDQNPLRQYAYNLAMVGMAGQVGCLTVLIVLVALIAGLFLDNMLGTRPLLTIILILLSAPFSLFLTYQVAVRAARNIQPVQKVEQAPIHSDTEERTGE